MQAVAAPVIPPASTTHIQGVAYDPSGPLATSSVAPVPAPAPALRLPSSATFDPSVHLCFEPPSKIYSFADLGLPSRGICETAASEAFPLFTAAGIKELRKDALSSIVHDNFTHHSTFAPYQAREYAGVASFVKQAFTHPSFINAISSVAGIELVPVMTLELGHTNFAALGGREAVKNLGEEPSLPMEKKEEDNDGEKAAHVVNWHFDSYPFVAVTMLSDVTNMIGGETAIRKGDGSVAKIRGPALGYTAVLQGRYVKHIACGAKNARERITMVTSFRAKDCSLPDESVLTSIRPVTQKHMLNREWSAYRLKLVAERMNKLASEIEVASADDPMGKKEVISTDAMKNFVDDQIKYLNHTVAEMVYDGVEYELVDED